MDHGSKAQHTIREDAPRVLTSIDDIHSDDDDDAQARGDGSDEGAHDGRARKAVGMTP